MPKPLPLLLLLALCLALCGCAARRIRRYPRTHGQHGAAPHRRIRDRVLSRGGG